MRRRNAELEEQVKSRTREAESANRAKSIFLANMSHELRTPLNGILGYAQILRKEQDLSDKNRRRLDVIGESGEQLLQMINEILDLSKIEAGKMTLQLGPVRLLRLVHGLVDLFQQRCFEKGLTFSFQIDPGLPKTLITDEQKLRQILTNLLGNALKFTHEGSVIFRVKRMDQLVRFEVVDTGVGIREADCDAVFQPFQQVAEPNLAAQGTGLGLAISQRMAELLGAFIRVESEFGKGSRFWFDLVFTETDQADSLELSAKRNFNGYRGPRKKILVVDDQEINRQVLREMLEHLGFSVEEAVDGEDCLQRCSDLNPDLVFMDLRMPEADGFETARRLRAQLKGRPLAIVAISASVFESDRQLAFNAGCDDFLSKPFKERQLCEILEKSLRVEWTHGAEAVGKEASSSLDAAGVFDRVVAGGFITSVAAIDELLEIGRSGDVSLLRERLAVFAVADPQWSELVQVLDALAVNFQMKRIRELLLVLKGKITP